MNNAIHPTSEDPPAPPPTRPDDNPLPQPDDGDRGVEEDLVTFSLNEDPPTDPPEPDDKDLEDPLEQPDEGIRPIRNL